MKNPFCSMYLEGDIGWNKCDHDVCMCLESYVDIYGYWRSTVPHSGVWKTILEYPSDV